MTRLAQASFPTRQQPLYERIYLAEAADEAWRPDETWKDWCDELDRPPTTEVYRTLRRACVRGRESFRSQRELGALHKVAVRTIGAILDDLARLHLIKLERERGTILAIKINDPPPVPANIDVLLRQCSYNRPPPSEADVRKVLDYFCEEYELRRRVSYFIRPRDRPLVRSLLKQFNRAVLMEIMEFALGLYVEETVIRHNEINIGSIHARIGPLAAAWRLHQGRMRPVNTGTSKATVHQVPAPDPANASPTISRRLTPPPPQMPPPDDDADQNDDGSRDARPTRPRRVRPR